MARALRWTWCLLLTASLALGHPHHPHYAEEDVYDQRQNGTDNIHVHVDGVVLIHAPAESLAALAAAADTGDFEQQFAELLGSLGEDGHVSSTSTTTGRPTESASTPGSSEKPQVDEGISSEKPHKDEGSSDKPQADKEVSADEKPQKDKADPTEKPQKDKGDTTEKPTKKDRQRVRLSSLLIPFLRRL